jgi:hypothetical protein
MGFHIYGALKVAELPRKQNDWRDRRFELLRETTYEVRTASRYWGKGPRLKEQTKDRKLQRPASYPPGPSIMR